MSDRFSDRRTALTRVLCVALGYNRLVGVMTADEAKRSEEAAPDKPKRRSQEVPVPLVDPPPDVSNPCLTGRHRRCTGKVALQQLRHGNRYARCQCPVCNHPKITRRMPLKS